LNLRQSIKFNGVSFPVKKAVQAVYSDERWTQIGPNRSGERKITKGGRIGRLFSLIREKQHVAIR
jgi:hypothetical protein